MNKNEAVVERLARVIAFVNYKGVVGGPGNKPVSESRIWEEVNLDFATTGGNNWLAYAGEAGAALRLGDGLGNGLWAAPESLNMGQWEAFVRGSEIPVKSFDLSDRTYELLLLKLSNGYKAMRRAAGGENDSS